MNLLFPLPDRPAQVIRVLVLEDLARIACHGPDHPMQPVLKERFDKQGRRKCAEALVPPTGFGDLP